MKIYTKTGDGGGTSLLGGGRIGKDALRIETYGTVDELSCVVGLCRSMNTYPEIDSALGQIQQDLFTLGADLATPENAQVNNVNRIEDVHITRLEQTIDAIDSTLPQLQNFILPGGNTVAAAIQLARAVCRRAERLAVRLQREEQIGHRPVVYLNRLSDLLFVLARKVNLLSSAGEIQWKP